MNHSVIQAYIGTLTTAKKLEETMTHGMNVDSFLSTFPPSPLACHYLPPPLSAFILLSLKFPVGLGHWVATKQLQSALF